MARVDTSGLDDVLAEMAKKEQLVGPVADRMLLAGAERVKDGWQRSAREHGHIRTGDMAESVGYARKPKQAGDSRYIEIYPQGKDRQGVSNAQKAFMLHYGTSRIKGDRWVDDANKYGEEVAVPAMIQVWEEANK